MSVEPLVHFNTRDYQSRLLSWFDKSGRHDLPWQGEFNPYHVWLSEVMLQQTQVKTVIPYFNAFINRFPTIQSLADASEDVLMANWAGLGYYARARNLQKSAKLICSQHNGKLPDSYDELIVLPGIGRSTANAILSIAFNQATAILDGNVKRVFARVFAIDQHPSEKEVEKKLWQIAEHLMPKVRTQAYTQAQMDLGATLCTRTKPGCTLCPHQSICLAHKTAKPEYYPVKKVKKAKPAKTKLYYLYRYQNKIYLQKNNATGIWGGLYVLPDSDCQMGEYHEMLIENQKHSFTHYDLYYDIKMHYLTENEFKHEMPSSALVEGDKIGKWVALEQLDDYALPAPFKKQLCQLQSS